MTIFLIKFLNMMKDDMVRATLFSLRHSLHGALLIQCAVVLSVAENQTTASDVRGQFIFYMTSVGKLAVGTFFRDAPK